ncbi:MAG: large conductance mechanosensitive channel protein MscL [Dehalococcoidia bacterium]
MVAEFKDFILRGNVVDMAVGIVIGVAFGNIVASLVNDVIMPPIGLLLGKVSFQDLYINLSGSSFPSLSAAKAAAAPTINYGLFLNTVFNFLIVAIVIFLIIRLFEHAKNRVVKPAHAAAPKTRECPYCISSVPVKASRCPHCTSDLT